MPSNPHRAQELGFKRTSWLPEHWGDAEIEVFKCIDEHWDLLINKKVDEFIKYIHQIALKAEELNRIRYKKIIKL